MAKGHITRKELKKDLIHDAGESMLDYWETHRTKVLMTVIVILAVLLAVPGIKRLVKVRQENAQAMLVAALDQMGSANMALDPTERAKALEEARKQCDKVRQSYPSVAAEALYVKGNAYYVGQDYDQAINVFKNYADQAQSSGDKAKGYLALGRCYENKFFLNPGSRDDAKQAGDFFGRAEKEGTGADGAKSFVAAQAMLGQGRVYRKLGDSAKAEEIFRAVEKNAPKLETEEKKAKPAVAEAADVQERNDRLQSIRDEIRNVKEQHSLRAVAEAELQDMGIAPVKADETTTATQSVATEKAK